MGIFQKKSSTPLELMVESLHVTLQNTIMLFFFFHFGKRKIRKVNIVKSCTKLPSKEQINFFLNFSYFSYFSDIKIAINTFYRS